jgi:hypothetical protein
VATLQDGVRDDELADSISAIQGQISHQIWTEKHLLRAWSTVCRIPTFGSVKCFRPVTQLVRSLLRCPAENERRVP